MMLADSHIHKFLTGKQVVVIATIQAGGEPLAMPNVVLHDLATLIMISVERFHAKYPVWRDCGAARRSPPTA